MVAEQVFWTAVWTWARVEPSDKRKCNEAWEKSLKRATSNCLTSARDGHVRERIHESEAAQFEERECHAADATAGGPLQGTQMERMIDACAERVWALSGWSTPTLLDAK